MTVPGVARFNVLGTPVACVDMPGAIQTVRGWLQDQGGCRTVTFTNVHMVMEGWKSEHFRELIASMDMNCPDGMPLVWTAHREGVQGIDRVSGPDFLPMFCEATADMKVRHFFYGGNEGVAKKTAEMLQKRIPGFQVAGIYSPPFRTLSQAEDEEIIGTINAAHPDVIWVCLGCPKQELWMQSHKDRLNAKVLLAVGLAFNVVAGVTKRAPRLLRACGMEWLYRLCQEPRRLWRRYLVYNTLFLYQSFREAWSQKSQRLQ
jgi:N-acetylglucosaminyldiphosphoundecaprenol N-acetyl-beta-D-mannosaminyltransferase